MVEVKHLFTQLDTKLIELLKSLSQEDWEMQTVAKLWRVKDVAAHLLDGNIRVLSIQRDRYFGEQPPSISAYPDLVNWLNQLNADWVKACKRISPGVLLLLHQVTGPLVSAYYESLNLPEKAIFPVAWAGEQESVNELHLAREYTEKWLHQQQIRDAVNQPGILTREFYFPFISTFMYGLPVAYEAVQADAGTIVQLTIPSDVGGDWFLVKEPEKWHLQSDPEGKPATQVIIPPDIAWKLFSKSIRPGQVLDQVKISGDKALGEVALGMVSVMA
ncbi:maleylpyruvate isomerase N-terminal domain-containing protein [Adhaeribacter swui]|uniref:Maleylpyruvate isomerase N-terminal domain-containing protein n=1 Tax=Adhaeribacter swui TaxID=2086471 RepID=A0A7G7G2X6_9BACT|nr:maleylpyruvate isomerase N-terminal domain-containing protein [Adhaeribacter swui]QNF31510.1 maleylpyruvate isomerase N-terminal domain-containing protein [Adhaeribacter swui]